MTYRNEEVQGVAVDLQIGQKFAPERDNLRRRTECFTVNEAILEEFFQYKLVEGQPQHTHKDAMDTTYGVSRKAQETERRPLKWRSRSWTVRTQELSSDVEA